MRRRAGGRVNLLFLVPIPLVFRAFGSDPVGLAANLCAFALLMGAAWLTREGVAAEQAYDARRIARRPRIPRKLMGSLATGAGLFLAGIPGADGALAPMLFGMLGVVLHATAFGVDPVRDKTAPGAQDWQSDRVARAVDEAENHLARMRAAVARLGDRRLLARVDRFQTTARAMFRRVEEDPRDLPGVRRYLGVYLLGARDASDRFADLYERRPDKSARADYVALLDDLETSFAERLERLGEGERQGLEIEIDTLRERLEREGVRAE